MTTGRYKANTKHTPRTLIWLKLKQDKLGKMTQKYSSPALSMIFVVFMKATLYINFEIQIHMIDWKSKPPLGWKEK